MAAPAQAQTRPAQPAPAADLIGKDTVEGVYVRDSAVAIEKLALGDRLARLNEWDKAADVYQEILVGYPDRVVPSAKDANNRIYQYTSVGDAVQQRLAKWPADGLAAYRNRYENEAAALLEQANADDPEALQRVLTNYFVTDSARSAAIRLIERYIQHGEFAPAVWLADRMLATHPSLGDVRPLFLYRAAIAAHLMGDDKIAGARVDELKRDFPQALGSISGKDVVLIDTLTAEIASTSAPVAIVAGANWRMPFGSPDRSAVPATTTTGTARVASIRLAEMDLKGLPEDSRKQLMAQGADEGSRARMTGIMPVVDRGELFFQDNARVYAVNLQSGQPLPGWAQTYNNPRLAPYRIPAFPNPRGQAEAVVVTDESVLAVMGQIDQVAAQLGAFSARDTRLVCLDRATGRERWVIEPEKLPQNTGPARALDLVGSPLVVGSRVYVMGRSSSDAQFEDAYVLCFDLSSGNYLWSSYLASASAITPMADMDGGRSSLGAAHLAYFSGRIYALTSLGVLSAIDAFSGATVWIDIYPRINNGSGLLDLGFGRRQVAQSRDDRPTTPLMVNPVIVSGGNVFVLPSDSQYVLIYDAASGQEIKRVSMTSYDNSVTLIGVAGNRLVLGSTDAVHCVDWQKYVPEKPSDAILWRSPSRPRSNSGDRNSKTNQLIGRPFLTTEHVFVTTATRLNRINLKTGSVEEFYPRDDRGGWPKKEGPGNVVVAQNHLIIAGTEQVAVYTDTDGAKARLDAVIAAAPSDPEPRLSYAEICFAADELPQAVSRLDEAIDLLGGRASLTPGRVRERLFQTTLGFAEELSARPKKKPEEVEFINGLYDRAAAAADAPAQQVAYRFSRGNFLDTQKAPEQQVTLYQEIISDPALRSAFTSRGTSAATRRERAGDVARDLIAQLIVKNGAAIYAASDRAATAQFQAAQAAADPAKLLDVSATYPNSAVARQAFLAAADAYQQAGQNTQANWVLRQYLFSFADPSQKVKRSTVFESMAQNYLAMPGRVEAAVGRLAAAASARGGAKLQHPLRLPDGKILDGVSYFDASTAVAAFSKPPTTPLPDVHVPIPPREAGQPYKPVPAFSAQADSAVVDGVDDIVEPLRSHVRFDRVIALVQDKGVAVYAPGASKPLYEVPGVTQAPAGAAWLGSDLLVWSGSRITLAADGGAVSWSVDIASLDMPESAAPTTTGDDAVASNDQTDLQVQQQRIILNNRGLNVQIRGNARVILRNGRMVNLQQMLQQQQQQAAEPAASESTETITRVVPLTDQVILSTSLGRVIAIDLIKGQTRWQSRISEKPVDRLLATDDFVVVRVRDTDDMSTLLTVFDAYDGQTRGALRFSGDLSTTAAPISLAVTPDGMLVYASTTRIVARDLFDMSGEAVWETPIAANTNNANVAQINGGSGLGSGEDILTVAAGRVLLLTDGGTYVRVYSLENGTPLKYDNVPAVLQTGATDRQWQVETRVVGTRLYTFSQRAVASFNLERRDGGKMDAGPVSIEDLLMTRDYVVLLHNPSENNDGGMPRFPGGVGEVGAGPKLLEMRLHSRAVLPSGRESGLMEYSLRLSEPSGFTSWHACEGGIYYLTGDRKLHFLKGLR